MRPVVAAAGIEQRFGHQRALRGVDLAVEDGERVAVVGDNGAGKTTLLRVLATVARPIAGSLSLFGVDALRQRGAVRPRIGWLGHQVGVYPALTARENLEFFCDLHGLQRSRAVSALEQVELADAGARPAGELSRGRQQRLALARSLLHDPELWVLDEPDTSLDARGRELLQGLAAGRTVIFSTHDSELALALAGRVLELRDGALVNRGALSLVRGS